MEKSSVNFDSLSKPVFRQYKRNSDRDIVFEIVIKGPDDLVGWEAFTLAAP